MFKKKGIKLIYSVCALIIVAILSFFTFKFIIPKAHSGIDYTTTHTTANKTTSTTVVETIIKIISETSSSTQTTTASTTKSTAKPTESTKETTKIAVTSSTDNVSTTALTTTVKTTDDFSVLDNCAFIGNSRVIALKNYGLAKNVYAVVGLTVDTIFTKSVAGSTIPVIDELRNKDFDKIFIMLGDNECGWPNKDIFIERYSKVIDAVKERVPNAEIYLQSVLPVSQNASDTSPFGVTNENINIMNVKIKQLAVDSGIYYINPASALKGSDGALPDEAASDGIHLNKKYCKIWLSYLIDNVFSEGTE